MLKASVCPSARIYTAIHARNEARQEIREEDCLQTRSEEGKRQAG
jgi:hypothetical protein